MVEGPIDEPGTWRTGGLALVIWALHFASVYAGALLFPNDPASRWVAAGATLIALLALAWVWRRYAPLTTIGTTALVFAGGAVIYDGLPPILVW